MQTDPEKLLQLLLRMLCASVVVCAQVFGLLDMQEQVEAALARLAPTLEGTPAAGFLADFTQLAAMLRQEVRTIIY